MNQERKQKLTQLLNEAIEDLEILPRYTDPPLTPIDIGRYKRYLQESWKSYSPDTERLVRQFKLEINTDTKSKLLDLISSELDPFIYEGKISTGYFYVLCVRTNEERLELNDVLEKLLNIAIFGGIDAAVSAFEECVSEDASASFESITLLEGITLETEIQVFDGIRLVPIPASSNLPRCFSSLPQRDVSNFYWKTMLVIDYAISPIFQKPSLAATAEDKNYTVFSEKPPMDIKGFRIKAKGGKSPEYTCTYSTIFHQKFCQALSLACNSGVKPAMSWKFVAENELLNINPRSSRLASGSPGPFKNCIKVSKDEINKAKCLYEILVDSSSNTPTNIAEKLQIPINRWIQSKSSETPEDKIIDLGIAFESLYLSDRDGNSELSFQFRLRGAWYLGKNKGHRKKLMKDFYQIYDWRSKVVHTGKIPNKTKKTSFTQQEIEEVIKKAQNLCLDTIKKILKKGKFPDYDYWNSLILG